MYKKIAICLVLFFSHSVFSENLANMDRIYEALKMYSEAEKIVSQKPIESIYIKNLAQKILDQELAPGKIIDTEKIKITNSEKNNFLLIKTGFSEFVLSTGTPKEDIHISALFSTEQYLIPATLKYIKEKYRKIPVYKPESVEEKDLEKLKIRSTFSGKFILVPLKSFHKKTFQYNNGKLNLFCRLLSLKSEV
ncbi:MAG: hypothetical protein H7A23_21470 [Leptospiraceae bacterium]|nr:hypothetical protein [Leptospiraceae bacterium]MCP5497133.1 hypothetical protein [Leptospiraceae bacterium]